MEEKMKQTIEAMERLNDIISTITAVKGPEYTTVLRYSVIVAMNYRFCRLAEMDPMFIDGTLVALSSLVEDFGKATGVDMESEEGKEALRKDLLSILRQFQ